jgi:hypothetical protein
MTQVSTFNGLLVSFKPREAGKPWHGNGQWFFACGLRFGYGETLFEAAALVLSERAEHGY